MYRKLCYYAPYCCCHFIKDKVTTKLMGGKLKRWYVYSNVCLQITEAFITVHKALINLNYTYVPSQCISSDPSLQWLRPSQTYLDLMHLPSPQRWSPSYVTGSWKTYLVGTKHVSGQSNQTFKNFFQYQFLLYILIKQLLSFLSVKFETYHFLSARKYSCFYTTR